MLPVNQDRGRFRKFGKLYKEGYHVGKDFDCDIGTPVVAYADGEIIFTGEVNGFGSMNPHSSGGVIIIQHDGYCTLYGHITREKRVVGTMVKEGERIGTVAKFYNTGFLLPHLHFGKYQGVGMPKTKWGYVKTPEELDKWDNPLI